MGLEQLPVAHYDRHAKALARLGWECVGGSGSHRVFKKDGHRNHITLPAKGDVKRGLLGRVLRDAGISIDEYVAAFQPRRKKS